MSPDSPKCFFDVDELDLRFERTIPAQISIIEETVTEILFHITQTECGRDKEFELGLALREALANAILHGAKEDSTKDVKISLRCQLGKGMLIIVRDPGRGFEPAEIPSPLIGENIYSNHGRGIFLINQLMDEVRFERGGTEIHMVKHH